MTEQNDQEKIVELENNKLEEENNNLMGHVNEGNVGLKEHIAKKNGQMAKMVEQNEKLGLKRKLMDAEQNSVKKLSKSSINRQKLPAELVNELFATMPMESAFDLLTKMSNGLLARNVQKMIGIIKVAMKANKWNAEDCGPKMTVSQDGLILANNKRPGQFNAIRAILPIIPYNLSANKSHISFYLEVQILNPKKVVRSKCAIKICDLGGLPRFRSIWSHYCTGMDAIIFMLDAQNRTRFEQAKWELEQLMNSTRLEGIPLLVLANKMDNDEGNAPINGMEELAEQLDLLKIGNERAVGFIPISCKKGRNIDIAMQWLLKYARR